MNFACDFGVGQPAFGLNFPRRFGKMEKRADERWMCLWGCNRREKFSGVLILLVIPKSEKLLFVWNFLDDLVI